MPYQKEKRNVMRWIIDKMPEELFVIMFGAWVWTGLNSHEQFIILALTGIMGCYGIAYFIAMNRIEKLEDQNDRLEDITDRALKHSREILDELGNEKTA